MFQWRPYWILWLFLIFPLVGCHLIFFYFFIISPLEKRGNISATLSWHRYVHFYTHTVFRQNLRIVIDLSPICLCKFSSIPSILLILLFLWFSSMVLRDLTLRSATSFGSFHLIRLLFDEYMFYTIENKVAAATGISPIAAFGNIKQVRRLPFCHPVSIFLVWNSLPIRC